MFSRPRDLPPGPVPLRIGALPNKLVWWGRSDASPVIPAEAGIWRGAECCLRDSGFRRNDGVGYRKHCWAKPRIGKAGAPKLSPHARVVGATWVAMLMTASAGCGALSAAGGRYEPPTVHVLQSKVETVS